MASRFLHIHNPTVVLTLSRIPRTSCDLLSCHTRLSDDAPREQNDERMMSTVHRVLKQLIGKTYLPVEVTFTHAPLSPLSTYRKVFGMTPRFNQRSMGFTIERKQLDVWRPGASAQLRETAETLLMRLAGPNEKTYAQSVASMARGLLISGEFTPEQAAGALGLHARTLQRRLKDEGSSFEKIKDEARRDWAESLLSQPAVPLTQIANILGYAQLIGLHPQLPPLVRRCAASLSPAVVVAQQGTLGPARFTRQFAGSQHARPLARRRVISPRPPALSTNQLRVSMDHAHDERTEPCRQS